MMADGTHTLTHTHARACVRGIGDGDGDDDETGATDGLKRKLSNAFCYFLIHR